MSMAIEVCSEISSAGISPRISFSHDLNQNEGAEHHHPKRLDTSLLDSTSDFDFCFGNYTTFVQELPSADELFSNGKILPIEIKKKHVAVSSQISHQAVPSATANHHHQQKPTENNSGKKRLKEFLSMSIDADEKPPSKSFWQFKRSSSLNCESTRSKSLIRSSLHFLSRSNSTGSAPNPKPTMLAKETQNQNKQHLQKQPSLSRKSSVSSTSSSGSFYSYKPPLKKSCGNGAYGNGVRVSPVLNLSHPFISNATMSFFGFAGSLFCNDEEKMREFLKTSQEVTSNGLAMVDQFSEVLNKLNIPNIPHIDTTPNERRLLQADGSPAWVPPEQQAQIAQATANQPNVVVALDGSGNYNRINEALKEVPKNNPTLFKVYIKARIYKEQVDVTKHMTNVMFIGDGPTKTINTGSLNYVDGVGTYRTTTAAVVGDGFIAKDIGFENTARAIKHQVVALRVLTCLVYNIYTVSSFFGFDLIFVFKPQGCSLIPQAESKDGSCMLPDHTGHPGEISSQTDFGVKLYDPGSSLSQSSDFSSLEVIETTPDTADVIQHLMLPSTPCYLGGTQHPVFSSQRLKAFFLLFSHSYHLPMPPKGGDKKPQDFSSQSPLGLTGLRDEEVESPLKLNDGSLWKGLNAIALSLEKFDNSQECLMQQLAQQRADSQDNTQQIINRLEGRLGDEEFNNVEPRAAAYVPPHVRNGNGNGARNDHQRYPPPRHPPQEGPVNQNHLREIIEDIAAFTWYINLPPNSVRTWEEMERLFHTQFYRTEPEVSMDDLSRLYQRKGESAEDYLARFKKLRNRCRTPLQEMEFVRLARNGLDIELRKKFEGADFRDFFEMSTKVTRYETLLRDENERRSSSYGIYYQEPNYELGVVEIKADKPIECPCCRNVRVRGTLPKRLWKKRSRH
ncbi:Pectinesterase, catalytic [Corchorus capsularis]|uniref:Pectinesterase, catalytic n=1 Tax=Corchorus capsularis TaxID=210143 RepID=A0A1R3K6E5_COCAP|nr:Pectinesterase, catalytic [Corchorus capsularis]